MEVFGEFVRFTSLLGTNLSHTHTHTHTQSPMTQRSDVHLQTSTNAPHLTLCHLFELNRTQRSVVLQWSLGSAQKTLEVVKPL